MFPPQQGCIPTLIIYLHPCLLVLALSISPGEQMGQ